MGNKNKGGREVRKPKASKKPKPAVTPRIVGMPPSPHAKDQESK